MDILDKVIWLTGASSGIGEEMAYQLSAKGARLIISARRVEELERVKNACKGVYSDEIKVLPLDLAKADELPEKAKTAKNFFNGIDILINNGGISQRALVIDTDLSVYRKIMEVDYFAPVQLTKLVLPGMLRRKTGQIVTLTSATGIISTPYRSAYAAAKHALHGFFDALHAEVYDSNLRVTLICPGYIQTNVSFNALTGSGKPQQKHDADILKGMPVKKAVSKMIRAIEKEKEEYCFGGFKEMMGVYLKRFFPGLFAKVIRNVKVK